jgi:hypothetical protein
VIVTVRRPLTCADVVTWIVGRLRTAFASKWPSG